MKKLLITLLAALFASGAIAQAPFPDIPENHWAGDAVADIAELGIVIGFPDGTFRGNEAFTRYQAALVVARLLDVINEDFDARMALSEEDMASLRNALQELASDVAAQGVRLSDVEGTVASLSDEHAATQSRLDELESMLQGMGDTDPDVIRDLLNQLASQRVAIDTAQAQAEAAEALANSARGAANAAAARARANEDAIAALNSVVQGLGNRITALEQAGRGQAPAAAGVPIEVLDRLARVEADLANIRDFTVVIRRDQTALRNQVSDLEAESAIQAAELAALGDRVTALEENPLGITGSIAFNYEVQRLIGTPFDIDRAYGLNNPRSMAASVFSSGTAELDGDAAGSAGFRSEVGEVAQDLDDIDGTDTPVSATMNLSTSFGNVFSTEDFGVAAELDLVRTTTPLTAPDGTVIPNPFVFSVSQVLFTLDPIGGDPLTFNFGQRVNAQFTPYVFDLENEPGFVLTIGAPDFLAFLEPNLTVAHTGQDMTADGQLDYFETGVHLEVSPLQGLTLGGTFAMAAANAEDKDDVQNDNINTSVFGVDGSASLSIFTLNFEYANSTITNNATATSSSRGVLFVDLDVDASGLPLVNTLSVNYRDIPADWFSGGYGLSDADAAPYAADQAGFGVMAGFDLFILDITAYLDMYRTGSPNANVTAFGVDVAAELFRGFELAAFYHQASINGTVVDATNSPVDATETAVVAGSASRGTHYDTGFGVELRHDGAAENALINGLNFGFGYQQTEADFSRSRLFADADMTINVSILSLTPYVQYETVADADAGADNTNTIAVGTGLNTQSLDVFFAPSLEAAVNYRTTSHSTAGGWTATEMQWSVGLVLGEFLFEESSFTARYGSWTGTNINAAMNTRGAGDFATDISAGDVNNGTTQAVSGYELEWDYHGLQLAYGVYVSDLDTGTAGNESSGQAFSISYSVEF